MKKFVLIKDEKSRVYAIEGELALFDFYELSVSKDMERDLGLSDHFSQNIHTTDNMNNNAILKQIEHQCPVRLCESKDFFSIGAFKLYTNEETLEYKSNRQKLTKREYDILRLLFENKNIIVSREKILESFWENSDFFSSRSLDVFISKLRKCLAYDPSVQIISIRRKGIMLRC